MFEVIQPEKATAVSVPLSPAIRAGDFVFVSGQAALNEKGEIQHGTFESEVRLTMENIRNILAGAGLTLRDVVQARAYGPDPNDFAVFNALYREYFSEPFPTRTTVCSGLLAGLKFEMDVVAYAGGKR
jgi:2-iminobutanoate/2-iminopropanoate deaminase